jgi:hypothetical protein
MSTIVNQPAFPAHARFDRLGQLSSALQFDGITMRDYFAAKALTALVHNRHPRDAAAEAYEYADAMLAARDAT